MDILEGEFLFKLFTSNPVLYCLQWVWARYPGQVRLQSKSPTALHTLGHWLVENIQKAVKCLVFSSKKGFDAIIFKLTDNVYVHHIKFDHWPNHPRHSWIVECRKYKKLTVSGRVCRYVTTQVMSYQYPDTFKCIFGKLHWWIAGKYINVGIALRLTKCKVVMSKNRKILS